MASALDNAKALYMEGIRDGRPREAIEKYTGARYTQHSTGVADGREGFVAFFEGFLERNPVRDIRIVRGWQDGRHVFLHVFQSLNHGEYQYVTTDFFDSDEDGRIIEHWDVIQEYRAPTPSGHAEIDGATEITDLDKTEENKALVRAMLEGPSPDRPVTHEEIVLCVGCGNFVATLCKTDWEGTKYAQTDVFRIENGRIVEHWANAEPVPEHDVNSGKF